MIYHYIPIKMTEKQAHETKVDNTKFWQRCRATRTHLHCWWEGKRAQPLRKQVVSYKFKRIIQASSSTLRHLPMRNENLCSHRNP